MQGLELTRACYVGTNSSAVGSRGDRLWPVRFGSCASCQSAAAVAPRRPVCGSRPIAPPRARARLIQPWCVSWEAAPLTRDTSPGPCDWLFVLQHAFSNSFHRASRKLSFSPPSPLPVACLMTPLCRFLLPSPPSPSSRLLGPLFSASLSAPPSLRAPLASGPRRPSCSHGLPVPSPRAPCGRALLLAPILFPSASLSAPPHSIWGNDATT